MNLYLKGKVAIVTRASKGIAAGIAKALAAEGVRVAVNYSNNQDNVDSVVQQIVSNGGEAIAVKGNVSTKDDIKEVFKITKQAFGNINIIVNNAGIFQFDPIEAFEVETFQKYFNTNVLRVFLTTQQALKHFLPAGRQYYQYWGYT